MQTFATLVKPLGPGYAVTPHTGCDLHVAGEVIGTLKAQTLVIVESGVIEGQISAETVVVSGRVTGPVSAKSVRLHLSARVDGDITYTNLQMENGARLNGRMTFDESAQSEVAPVVVSADPLDESPSAELLRLTARLRA